MTTLAFAERNIVGDVELNQDGFFVVILPLLYIYISYAYNWLHLSKFLRNGRAYQTFCTCKLSVCIEISVNGFGIAGAQ